MNKDTYYGVTVAHLWDIFWIQGENAVLKQVKVPSLSKITKDMPFGFGRCVLVEYFLDNADGTIESVQNTLLKCLKIQESFFQYADTFYVPVLAEI